jgi:ABC-type lipoprotein release transport system permease subunit
MYISNKKVIKSQSMLEYLVTLVAIIIAIAAGTIGLNTGVTRGMNNAQRDIAQNITQSNPPAQVMGESYYSPTQTHTSDSNWQRVDYGGAQYKNEYYYHEGPSDMSYVPEEGKPVDSDTGFVAPPKAGDIK